MKRAHLTWVSMVVAACAGSNAASSGAPVVALDLGQAGDSAMWERLSTQKLEGLALVWSDAVLHPSAEAARAAAPKRVDAGESARAVQILADEGDVVKVRTWLSPRVRRGMHALTSYDLTLYASRAQLVPVLAQPIAQSFDDGSGYALFEGLPLRATDKGLAPIDPVLAKLEVALPSAAVSLAFPLRGEDETLESTKLEELACEYAASSSFDGEEEDEGRARVEPAAKKREALAAKRRAEVGEAGLSGMGSLSGYGYDDPGCRLAGRSRYARNAPPAEELRVSGRAFVAAADVAGEPCEGRSVRTYRAPKGAAVLVDLVLGRAIVRASVAERALRASGGCGIGIGGGGLLGRGGRDPAPPKVLAAQGKVKVYFPDGGLAGYHMEGTTRMKGARERGARLCIDHPNVSSELCFDRADLSEVEEGR